MTHIFDFDFEFIEKYKNGKLVFQDFPKCLDRPDHSYYFALYFNNKITKEMLIKLQQSVKYDPLYSLFFIKNINGADYNFFKPILIGSEFEKEFLELPQSTLSLYK